MENIFNKFFSNLEGENKNKEEEKKEENKEKDREKEEMRFNVLDRWLNGKDKEALDEFLKNKKEKGGENERTS